jgi:hypothetical protein
MALHAVTVAPDVAPAALTEDADAGGAVEGVFEIRVTEARNPRKTSYAMALHAVTVAPDVAPAALTEDADAGGAVEGFFEIRVTEPRNPRKIFCAMALHAVTGTRVVAHVRGLARGRA